MPKRCTFLLILLACNTLHAASPGLIASFESKTSPADLRVARLAALYVPQGTPASTFTPAGPFKATFSGNLEMKLKDELSFALVGRGMIKLSINGQAILELAGDNWRHEPTQNIELKKGRIRLSSSTAARRAGMRSFDSTGPAANFRPSQSPLPFSRMRRVPPSKRQTSFAKAASSSPTSAVSIATSMRSSSRRLRRRVRWHPTTHN
jgi:hypothetical protein